MPPKYRNALIFVIVILALLAFACVSTITFYKTLTMDDVPKLSEPFIYVSNILTGLEGGIVAVGFGVSPPTARGPQGLLARNIVGLGSFIVDNQPPPGGPTPSTVKGIVGTLYAAIYVAAGFAAIGVWLYDDKPPDLVKSLATVSIGM